jgi:hypothetical protein
LGRRGREANLYDATSETRPSIHRRNVRRVDPGVTLLVVTHALAGLATRQIAEPVARGAPLVLKATEPAIANLFASATWADASTLLVLGARKGARAVVTTGAQHDDRSGGG